MKEVRNEGASSCLAFNFVADDNPRFSGPEVAAVYGAAGQITTAVMCALQHDAVLPLLVVEQCHIRTAPTAEGAKEIGLVRALKAKCIVTCRAPGLLPPLPFVVFKNALIDDDAPTANRPLET